MTAPSLVCSSATVNLVWKVATVVIFVFCVSFHGSRACTYVCVCVSVHVCVWKLEISIEYLL